MFITKEQEKEIFTMLFYYIYVHLLSFSAMKDAVSAVVVLANFLSVFRLANLIDSCLCFKAALSSLSFLFSSLGMFYKLASFPCSFFASLAQI